MNVNLSRPSSFRIVIIATLILQSPVTGDVDAADELSAASPDDSIAIAANEIFGDEVIAANVAGVRQKAQKLSPEQRYQFLRSHVLPSTTHSSIRLAGLQTETSPVPSRITKEPLDVDRLRIATEMKQRRVSVGGNVVSPAFDLVRVARQLGRLQELKQSVLQLSPDSEHQQRCRLVMLALIELQLGEAEAAGKVFDEFAARWQTRKESSLEKRWPETLLVWSAVVEHGALLDESHAMLFDIITEQIRKETASGPEHWNRLISNLKGRVHTPLNLGAKFSVPALHPYDSSPPLKLWHPVTHYDAWSHGIGVPPGVWQLRNGVVSNPASHDTEFLFFEVPLLGDFALECECTCFGYEDTHPFVAGTWLAPEWNHSVFSIGGLKSARPIGSFEPKLTRVDEWLRYRVVINDNVCRRYINGRLVHEEVLSKDREPWVAIRSPEYGRGNVRDIRITGNPQIPKSVNLTAITNSQQDTAASKLPWPTGWYPWIPDDHPGPDSNWQTQTVSGQASVLGKHTPKLSGTATEQLLNYHWPIIGNSHLRWEFFYRQGQSLVCPALGRKVFLLQPDGVQVHWITNGVWGAADLDPVARSFVANEHAQSGPVAVPLRDNEWNSAELQINGDRVVLKVNGQHVFADDIHLTNDRRFGMFYFSDQTQAQFRDVVLTGDWPKTLPDQAQQELRDSSTDELDRQRAKLSDSFEFDFSKATDNDFARQFLTSGGYADRSATFKKLEKGMQVSLTGPARTSASLGYCAPRIVVSGDYDIIAEYTDLSLEVSGNGSSAIYLANSFGGDRMFHLYRGVVEYPTVPKRQQAQAEIYDRRDNRLGYRYPAIIREACTSGRLRMTRRGKELTFLIAEYDSDCFRKLHSEEVTQEDLAFGSLHLRSSCYSSDDKPSSVNVVWTKLSVKADGITEVFPTTGE